MKDITDIVGVTRDATGRLWFEGKRLYHDDDPFRNSDGTLKLGINRKWLIGNAVYFCNVPVKIGSRRLIMKQGMNGTNSNPIGKRLETRVDPRTGIAKTRRKKAKVK